MAHSNTKNNSNPLVSVFLPAYNQEEFIGEAIDSVLQQDYENIQIVIGDDCSQDATWSIIKEYQDQNPKKIEAFQNDENLGITGNCNKVLSRCSGKYITFHAGDDIFLPGKISTQVEYLESDSSNILCYHDVEVFSSRSGEAKYYWNSDKEGTSAIEGSTNKIAKQLVAKGTSFLGAQSVMVCHDSVPEWGYDERIPIASDWLMWIDVCAQNSGHVVFIDDVLSRYRKRTDGATKQHSESNTDQFVTLAIVEDRYPELRNSVRQHRGRLYYSDGVAAIQDDNPKRGRKHLLEGVWQSPHSWKWIGWWLYAWLKQYNLI